MRTYVVAWARSVVMVCASVLVFAAGMAVLGQENAGGGEAASTTVVLRGRVVNKVTGEAIGRALVTTAGNEFATMTNDRGEFEFVMTQRESETNSEVAGNGVVLRTKGPNARKAALRAKKPGYLESRWTDERIAETSTGVTIYLVPEAMIVGHVNVPGTEGEARIQCELYRRHSEEGKEKWEPAGTFMTWANGEFRFSELRAGTYRLITHEQMDQDSLAAGPGAEMFGYPPIYYPNTTDFSLASGITVKAGETAHANVTVERHAYYPVKIPVVSSAMVPMQVIVYPMGHWGPGWALGYNPTGRTIEGLLPDGNYTVELEAFAGATGSTGITNFAVRGGPFEGPPARLVENATVTVKVREEFQHEQNGGAQGMVGMTNRGPENVSVVLRSTDDRRGGEHDVAAQPLDGADPQTLVAPNVRPGRYRVTAFAGNAYAASIESGGADLLKQQLVVGMGGAVPPIEVTLRDDGAEVSGTVEEAAGSVANEENAPTRFVYLVPVGGAGWQQAQIMGTRNGSFTVPNVPPGDYLALAYSEVPQDLALGDEEFVKRMEGLGQKVHVEAGEKVSVKLKVIAGSEGE